MDSGRWCTRSCRARSSSLSRGTAMMLNRRHFLRAATGSLVLPWLDAFAVPGRVKPKNRMVCLCAPLGLHPAYFFPEKPGKDYALSPYLEVLKDFRQEFTVISGLCHAG